MGGARTDDPLTGVVGCMHQTRGFRSDSLGMVHLLFREGAGPATATSSVVICTRVDRALSDALDRQAQAEGRTRSNLMAYLLRQAVTQRRRGA